MKHYYLLAASLQQSTAASLKVRNYVTQCWDINSKLEEISVKTVHILTNAMDLWQQESIFATSYYY